MSTNCDGNSRIGNGTRTSPASLHRALQILIEGIFPARTLSRVEQPEYAMTSQDNRKPTGRLHSCACVTVANCSDEALTIPKATVLGIVEGISECLVDKINARSEYNFIEPAKPPRKRKNENLQNKYLHGKLDHLTPEKRESLLNCS